MLLGEKIGVQRFEKEVRQCLVSLSEETQSYKTVIITGRTKVAIVRGRINDIITNIQ